MRGKLNEHLAVELDFGLFKKPHEGGVREPIRLYRGADIDVLYALNHAFFYFSVPIRMGACFGNCCFCKLNFILSPPTKAFCVFENIRPAFIMLYSSLYSRHRNEDSSARRTRGGNPLQCRGFNDKERVV